MSRREFSIDEFVPVQAILPERSQGEGALVVMRDASFRLLIRCGSVNFDLKSVPERDAIVATFGELLEALDPQTPLQVQQRSKLLDATAYVRQFERPEAQRALTPRLRQLVQGHLAHYQSLIREQNLLKRENYVVLSSRGAQRPVDEKASDSIPLANIWRAFSQRSERYASWREPTVQEIAAARSDLAIRADELEQRLRQMGLSAQRLDEGDLRELLFELYHPRLAERQRLPQDDSGLAGLIASLPRRRRSPSGAEPPPAPPRALGPASAAQLPPSSALPFDDLDFDDEAAGAPFERRTR
jgi:hypothetical protein